MSKRLWSSVLCGTALIAIAAARVAADDVPAPQPAPAAPALSATAPAPHVLAEPTNLRDVGEPGAMATPAEAAVAEPVDADANRQMLADTPPGVSPSGDVIAVAPAPAAVPTVPAVVPEAPTPAAVPTIVEAPAAQPETPSVVAIAPVEPAKAEPAKIEPATPEPAKPAVAAVVTTAPVDTPAPAALAAPAPSPLITASAPVAAPVPAKPAVAAPPPVAEPVPVVATPVAPSPVVAAAPAEPAVVPAPAPAPVTLAVSTADLSAGLKSAIDARLALKPMDDKRTVFDERRAWAAIAAFYAERAYQPLFVDGKGLAGHGLEAIDRLGRAAEDGLSVADYPVPALAATPDAAELAKAELQLVESAIKYARHAQAGRFEPIRLSELVTAKPPVPKPEDILKTLGAASDVSAALEAFNPPHEGYKRLKAKLAELGPQKAPTPVARVPAGPVIRPGDKDTRVAVLRERLGGNGTPVATDADLYDPDLVKAVKTFQKAKGLNPSGLVGPQTVNAVNEAANGTDSKYADIVANMERWRWLPRDLGSMHVMVNVPDFSLAIMRDGVATHRARVIVGRVQNQTPIFSETMTHIIVNPYWNVPVSIVKKEYLGKAQETLGASLTRGNFEVEIGNKVVDPTAVDWTTVNASQVHLRQRPGDGNALGNIKFMFPNQHSVYIHDTSSRGLFQQSYRSLSHGCVRVQDPFSFADALLAEEPTALTGAKLKAMIGGGEKYLWLKRPIPVHIAYFTYFVDETGVLQTRPDLYGHNAKVKQLLGL